MLRLADFAGKRICVAISGGGDSVALLHYLKAEQAKHGYTLLAAHCEHGIRGEESLEDMRFVEGLCKGWNIPLFCFQADCPARAREEKISLETAARHFRYESFNSLLKEEKTDYIATAHHLGDEAETVLFRLARGTSLTGAAAMTEREGCYLRPLLAWSKEEIEEYLQKNALSFRVDSTNLQTDATRNKIRLEILPKLEEAVDGAIRNIANFARLAKEDDELLQTLSKALLLAEGEKITVLFSDKKPLFTRACVWAMKALGVQKDYTSVHLEALYFLQNAERGAWLTLPKLRAIKTETGICFFAPKEEETPSLPPEKPFDLEGYDGGRYEVKISSTPFAVEGDEKNAAWTILRLDREKLPKAAVFRFRKEGDRMRPFGGGSKSLKKLFNEKKIPPTERGYLPLIADEERVYAVCGVEISEDVKIDENTKQVLYIALRKKEKGHGNA